jgi:hypothetical protein
MKNKSGQRFKKHVTGREHHRQQGARLLKIVFLLYDLVNCNMGRECQAQRTMKIRFNAKAKIANARTRRVIVVTITLNKYEKCQRI